MQHATTNSLWSRRELLTAGAKLMACAPFAGTLLSAAQTQDRDSPLHDWVLANHILAAKDVVDGYGHVSVRRADNDGQYLLARSMAPALVTDSDVMTFDLDSNPAVGDTRRPYIERFIHGEIYRARPDVNAVVHCHSPELIPFADTAVPLRPLYHMSAFLAFGVPVFEIREARPASDKLMLVHTHNLGQALARVLGSKGAALMRGHGAVVVGASLPEVVGRAFYLQLNAKLQAQAMMLGRKITYLTPEEAQASLALGYDRDWDVWKRELESPRR
jgi:ribulose-5-phosphate 4-epimerase/fuculose-1-phosphate aldolase